MPRKTQEEIGQEVQVETPQTPQGVMEVPINLELLNNKINYIISKIDMMTSSIPPK